MERDEIYKLYMLILVILIPHVNLYEGLSQYTYNQLLLPTPPTFQDQKTVTSITCESYIEIREDGSVYPKDAPVVAVNSTHYFLAQNITVNMCKYGILIRRNNIVLDGNGYSLIAQKAIEGIEIMASNVTIRNILIKNFGTGILVSNTSRYVRIEKSIFMGNTFGILLLGQYIVIRECIIRDGDNAIIILSPADKVYVIRNQIINNTRNGIKTTAIDILLKYNYISGSKIGVYILVILPKNHKEINITNNILTRNGEGLKISAIRGKSLAEVREHLVIRVLNNTFSHNDLGVKLKFSTYAIFANNNFMENGKQVELIEDSVNTWYLEYPVGGNYWSDYRGVDKYSGPNQDQPGSDGIGDIPYIIDDRNIDKYPLMNPINNTYNVLLKSITLRHVTNVTPPHETYLLPQNLIYILILVLVLIIIILIYRIRYRK